MEVFKDIEDYKGLYQVSNYGRIKNVKTGIILKPAKAKRGYLIVRFWKDKGQKMFLIHRLVAQAFIPNPNNLPEVNHKDEDKANNGVDNLEWCDRLYNIRYGTGIQRRTKTNKNGKRSKSVGQYDLQGILIRIYPSVREVERQKGFIQGNISACCRGESETSYGYKWKYQ